MNPETLERLLIDRAVGELPSDSAALLDAYLSHEPDAARQAAEINETLDVARLALAGTPAQPGRLPELSNIIPLAPAQPPPRARYSLWPLAAAACFVGGLILGLSTMRGPGPHPVMASAPPSAIVARSPSDKSDFWSVERIRSHHQKTLFSTHKQIKWTSPVRKPEIVPSL